MVWSGCYVVSLTWPLCTTYPECKGLVTVVEVLTSKVPTCRKAGFVHVTGVITGRLLCHSLNGLLIDNEVVMAKIQRVGNMAMKRRRGRVE